MDSNDWGGGWRRDRPVLGLDWRSGQKADSGWIPARVNRQLAFTQVRPERRRISIVRNGGGWRLGNGLDVAISELHWSDASGGIWQARDVASGQEVVLNPARSAAQRPDAVLQRLGVDARLSLDGAGREAGTFIARLAAPLLPIPGPDSEDVGPVEAWLTGRIDGIVTAQEAF